VHRGSAEDALIAHALKLACDLIVVSSQVSMERIVKKAPCGSAADGTAQCQPSGTERSTPRSGSSVPFSRVIVRRSNRNGSRSTPARHGSRPCRR
jgi:hypothetical protein